MIVTDVNLLIYAVNQDAPLHKQATRWLEDALSGTRTVAFSWSVLLAFLRLTTRPGLFRHPLTGETAFELVEIWLSRPVAVVLNPGPRHMAVLRGLLAETGTGGNLTSDAHLAALAIENRAELYSADRDFARFPGLKWRNPLVM